MSERSKLYFSLIVDIRIHVNVHVIPIMISFEDDTLHMNSESVKHMLGKSRFPNSNGCYQSDVGSETDGKEKENEAKYNTSCLSEVSVDALMV